MNGERVAACLSKHADELTRFAATLVGSDDADDVVSVAVLGVLAARTDNIDDIRGYLYRSVLNASRKHWRTLGRRQRREVFTFDAGVDSAEFRPEVAGSLASIDGSRRATRSRTGSSPSGESSRRE